MRLLCNPYNTLASSAAIPVRIWPISFSRFALFRLPAPCPVSASIHMCSTPNGGWLKLDPHIPISAGSTALYLNLEGVFGSCKILQATRDRHRCCSSCVVVRIDQSAIELGTRTEGLFLLRTSHEMHSVDTSEPPRNCMRHGMILRRCLPPRIRSRREMG